MAKSRLHELQEHGQSVWIDTLSREMLETGELERLMEEDAVVGVTSNPTIFEKALSEGAWYDEQLRRVLTYEDDPKEIFLALAVEDIVDACDLLRLVWEQTGRIDGRVSLEVDPAIAYDRDASYAEAMRIHELVDRPNLYVKIPGTEPGLGAIEDCIAVGRPIAMAQVFNGMGCTGENQSPALQWKGAPAGTKSFAVTMYDPDAPTGSGWWHWVVYNLPADVTSLPAGAGDPAKNLLPAGATQGNTDFGAAGYGGPCPPQGDKPHRYVITVYALKTEKLDLPANATAAYVGFNLHANTLAKTTLTARFGR